MLFYRAALPMSSRTLTYVAGIICRHRASIGSCWRNLNPGRQAFLVLAHRKTRRSPIWPPGSAPEPPQPGDT